MNAVLGPAYVDDLRALGVAAGLDRVGVASAEVFDDARSSIEARKAAGYDAGMQFTFRNPARSTDPRQALPSAQALVVGARAYPTAPPDRPSGAHGRVARYAADDEYAPLRAGLHVIADRLEADGWQTRVLCDDNALVDRAAAHRAGLGWYGKNANVLLPGHGSWFVLGSVVTDAPLPVAAQPVPDGCGGCTRCIDGCPTNAIVAPGVVDARRCLAWLVQAEGDFPEPFRVALGDRIYGCDDCQEVCPPNRRLERDPEHARPTGRDAWVDLVELLEADDADLLARHGRWYIPRRDPRYLRRNALVALGNVGDADRPTSRRGARALPRRRRRDAATARRLGHSADRPRRDRRTLRHLLVTNDFPPKFGGIQSYLWELWRRLPPGDTTVLTTAYDGAPDFDAAQPFRVERVGRKVMLPTRRLVREVDELAARVDADLVLLDPALPLGRIGPRLARPYGVVIHGAEVTIPGRLPLARSPLARVLRGARLVVAAGGYPAREAERAAKQALPTVVVPPGVDVERFHPLDDDERVAARHHFGVPPGAELVVCVSRLVPRKGMDTLIRSERRKWRAITRTCTW